MEIIETSEAPAAIGPYSQAVRNGGLVWTSGQIPLSPETGEITGKDIAAQTRQVIDNLAAALRAAGSGLPWVIKTTCYLTDMKDFDAFNRVYGEYFTGKPARSTLAVRELPRGALVEIEALAQAPAAGSFSEG
ncbi:MAG: RidA family protein [Spirochaetales bacterium]|jgi:2-iminobutanoate/2-iminopropanoate deaminase|nr:RidA family protein [Spirochaetales bacterium]